MLTNTVPIINYYVFHYLTIFTGEVASVERVNVLRLVTRNLKGKKVFNQLPISVFRVSPTRKVLEKYPEKLQRIEI